MIKRDGFSLMEMMVVLLIVSVVAAASAPMVNKKLTSAVTDKSPWVWVGNQGDIAFNMNGAETVTASIGRVQPVAANARDPRLYIDVQDAPLISQQRPHLAFGNDGANVFKFRSWSRGFAISNRDTFPPVNSVAIGYSARTSANSISIGYESNAQDRSVAIGDNATTTTAFNVAIGHDAQGQNVNATCIGAETRAGGDSVAMGRGANATGSAAVSLGMGSNASGSNALAIGRSANTGGNTNAIAIGRNANALMSTSIAIGHSANVSSISAVQARAIAIGYEARALASDTIAIGGKYGASATRATNTGAIAIGSTTQASGFGSIAIGGTASTSLTSSQIATTTTASSTNSIAIGTQASAAHTNSTAIGRSATTTASNQIVLGTASDTVYIPGQLIVGKEFAADCGYFDKYAIIWDQDQLWGRDSLGEKFRQAKWEDFNLDASDQHKPDTVKTWRAPKLWGGYFSFSDRRLKNVGKVFTAGLKEIKKLEVFNYTFKSDKSKTPRVGVIAQDLQKIFPDAVFKGDDGFLRIRMEDMFYALINAVKELSSLFEDHDMKINELQKQNKELLKTISDLEAQVHKLEKSLENLEKKIK